jgi:hypothetical protein
LFRHDFFYACFDVIHLGLPPVTFRKKLTTPFYQIRPAAA